MKILITSTLAFTFGLAVGSVGTVYAVREVMEEKGLSYEEIILDDKTR